MGQEPAGRGRHEYRHVCALLCADRLRQQPQTECTHTACHLALSVKCRRGNRHSGKKGHTGRPFIAILTRTRTRTHAHAHTHAHTHARTHTHARARARTHARTQGKDKWVEELRSIVKEVCYESRLQRTNGVCVLDGSWAQSHTHTHTHTHARAHTHTHTH